MYGFIDRAAPSLVYSRPGASLGDIWRYLEGCGNVAIIRLADDRVVAERPSNWDWSRDGESVRGAYRASLSTVEVSRRSRLFSVRLMAMLAA